MLVTGGYFCFCIFTQRLSRALSPIIRRADQPHTSGGRVPLRPSAARGLEVSLCHVLEDLLLEPQFCHQLLELGILLLQLLEPLGLLQLQPAVLLASAVVGLLGSARLPRIRRLL